MPNSEWSTIVCNSDLRLADLAEEGDVFQPVEPFGIVQHHGVGRSVAKAQELLEYPLDRGDVGGDHLIAHQPARFVLEARVADLAGTAAHQHDRLVPRLRSEEHTSELQSLMRITYAVVCLKK